MTRHPAVWLVLGMALFRNRSIPYATNLWSSLPRDRHWLIATLYHERWELELPSRSTCGTSAPRSRR